MMKLKNVLGQTIRNGLGAVGDRMNEEICPIILYQPKACRRGEQSEKNEISGWVNKNSFTI